jgi:hypothetical protein
MPDPARDSDCLATCANLFSMINHYADLALLDVEDFILMDMNMFKRNITIRLHDPFHDVRPFSGGKTPEGLLGDRIGE